MIFYIYRFIEVAKVLRIALFNAALPTVTVLYSGYIHRRAISMIFCCDLSQQVLMVQDTQATRIWQYVYKIEHLDRSTEIPTSMLLALLPYYFAAVSHGLLNRPMVRMISFRLDVQPLSVHSSRYRSNIEIQINQVSLGRLLFFPILSKLLVCLKRVHSMSWHKRSLAFPVEWRQGPDKAESTSFPCNMQRRNATLSSPKKRTRFRYSTSVAKWNAPLLRPWKRKKKKREELPLCTNATRRPPKDILKISNVLRFAFCDRLTQHSNIEES